MKGRGVLSVAATLILAPARGAWTPNYSAQSARIVANIQSAYLRELPDTLHHKGSMIFSCTCFY